MYLLQDNTCDYPFIFSSRNNCWDRRSGRILGELGEQGVFEALGGETIVIKDEGSFANLISTVAHLLMPTVVHIEIAGTVVQRSHYYYFGHPRQREVPI